MKRTLSSDASALVPFSPQLQLGGLDSRLLLRFNSDCCSVRVLQPVNRGEDPYDAADRFMEREGMPVSYRCTLAQPLCAIV